MSERPAHDAQMWRLAAAPSTWTHVKCYRLNIPAILGSLWMCSSSDKETIREDLCCPEGIREKTNPGGSSGSDRSLMEDGGRSSLPVHWPRPVERALAARPPSDNATPPGRRTATSARSRTRPHRLVSVQTWSSPSSPGVRNSRRSGWWRLQHDGMWHNDQVGEKSKWKVWTMKGLSGSDWVESCVRES